MAPQPLLIQVTLKFLHLHLHTPLANLGELVAVVGLNRLDEPVRADLVLLLRAYCAHRKGQATNPRSGTDSRTEHCYEYTVVALLNPTWMLLRDSG